MRADVTSVRLVDGLNVDKTRIWRLKFMNPWIKIHKQVPPLNELVEVLYTVPGEEPRVSLDKLISYTDGSYMYWNGDYSDCVVLAWRKYEGNIEDY